MAHCEDDGHWCPDCHMETRPSEVRSDALFGVSDPCKTCSDRDKAGDDEPCASCGPPAWEYHDRLARRGGCGKGSRTAWANQAADT